MRKESMDFLTELLGSSTPSGFEAPGQRIWCEYARQFADEVTTDSYGNAVAVLNPSGSPRVMLDGHADEIGLIVKHIVKEGFIYFQRIGGVDPALISGKRVNIHTAKGTVRGVIGATAIHLRDRDKDPKVPKMHELFIDIGARSDTEARKQVCIGDPITFVDGFEMLNKNIGISRAFDNRVGTWAAIEALRLVASAKVKPKCAIYACSSIQEETGCNGAKMTAFTVKPDVAIAVDVTHATDTPGIDSKQHGEVKMSGGPTIALGRENHPAVTARLQKIAKAKKIKYQLETFSVTGGTDALSIWTQHGGVPTTIMSIPNRYMHSTVEMLDIRDLQATAELIAAFCSDLKKNERFTVKV